MKEVLEIILLVLGIIIFISTIVSIIHAILSTYLFDRRLSRIMEDIRKEHDEFIEESEEEQ